MVLSVLVAMPDDSVKKKEEKWFERVLGPEGIFICRYGLKHLVLLFVFVFYTTFGGLIFLIIENPAQAVMKEEWIHVRRV